MRKFVPFLVTILVSLISCQEDDDLTLVNGFKNKVELFEKTAPADEEIRNANLIINEGDINIPSSKEGDPPVKNGDHWKY